MYLKSSENCFRVYRRLITWSTNAKGLSPLKCLISSTRLWKGGKGSLYERTSSQIYRNTLQQRNWPWDEIFQEFFICLEFHIYVAFKYLPWRLVGFSFFVSANNFRNLPTVFRSKQNWLVVLCSTVYILI